MDCCVSYNRIPIGEALPAAVKFEGDRKVFAKFGFSDSFSYSSIRSQVILKVCGTWGFGQRIESLNRVGRPGFAVFASTGSSHCEFSSLGTPLEPRSFAGKFLSGILQNQRHIFHFAVEEQLEELTADRNGAFARKEHSSGSTESCLHRRIAEMKDYECQIAVEDVMYMLIVHRFSEIKVPMVPKLSRCVSEGKLQIWPSKDKELETIYNAEVQEMIREHLATILSWRGRFNGTGNSSTTRLRRLQLGRIYAASIMYGYFLKSACLRHHLELSLALTHDDLPLRHSTHFPLAEFQPHGTESRVFLCQSNHIRSTSLCQESQKCVREPEKLRGFVMGFDPETLRRCAKLKSREAVNLIEKHTWALFEDEKTGELRNDDEEIIVTVPSLKRLVMEAVAFGSFLWDVERYVDSLYSLKEN